MVETGDRAMSPGGGHVDMPHRGLTQAYRQGPGHCVTQHSLLKQARLALCQGPSSIHTSHFYADPSFLIKADSSVGTQEPTP